MRKISILLLFFAIFTTPVLAQDTVFIQQFEQPTFTNMTSFGVQGFTTNTTYAAGGSTGSVLGKFNFPLGTDTTQILTSNSFSTVGNFLIKLSFQHIALIFPNDSGWVELSNNNGPWVRLTAANSGYVGGSLNHIPTANPRDFRFTAVSYSSGANTWPSAPGGLPTNNMWKPEVFNISSLASNSPNVRVRFVMRSAKLPIGAQYFGWLIDNIVVTAAISELDPPIIVHAPILGNQFNTTHTFNATVTDSSGVDSVQLFYRTSGNNYSTVTQVNMPRTTGNNFSATRLFPDGDTVRYHIKAIDSAAARNVAFKPDSVNFPNAAANQRYHQFVASGPPTIVYPALPNWLGPIYQLGPFPIAADITDASGIANATLFYKINGGPTQSVAMVRDLTLPNRWLGTVPQVLDSTAICYTVRAVDSAGFVTLSPDTAANWCVREFLALEGKVPPFFDDFDNANFWEPLVVAGIAPGWERGTPTKPTLNSAYSGTNAWVTRLATDYPANADFSLLSPVFNFSGTNVAILSFFQQRLIQPGTSTTIGNQDGFTIQYSTNVTNNNGPWINIGFPNEPSSTNWFTKSQIQVLSGPGWDGYTNGWEKSEIFLSNIPQTNVRFRFRFRSNASLHDEGVAIDNFEIRLPDPVDASLNAIAGNLAGGVLGPELVAEGDTVQIFGRIRNQGGSNITNATIRLFVNGVLADTAIFTGNVTSNNNSNYFSFGRIVVPPRSFSLCAVVVLPNDGFSGNDTLCTQLFGVPVFPVPFFDNFDSTTVNWFTASVGGNGINEWELGTPSTTNLNAAASPPNAWVTNLDGNYAAQTNSTAYELKSPFFTFDNAINTRLRFKMKRVLSAGAGLKVQYQVKGQTGWTDLGIINDQLGSNWYNGTITGTLGGAGWIGNTPGTGYQEVEYLLEGSTWNNSALPKRFRLLFVNYTPTTNQGVSIDDFEIAPPTMGEVRMLSIESPLSSPAVDSIVQVRVRIKNQGGDTLTNIPINYTLNNVVQLTPNFIFPGPLLPGETSPIINIGSFPSTIVGQFNICTYVAWPTDPLRNNDTLCRTVTGLPRFNVEVVSILAPPASTCFPTGPSAVSVTLKNTGHSTVTSQTLNFRLNNNPVVSFVNNVHIGRDSSITVTFPSSVVIPVANNVVRVWIDSIISDVNRFNDTASVNVTGVQPKTLTYRNDFENGPASIDFCTILGQASQAPACSILVQSNVGLPGNAAGLTMVSLGATGWSNTNTATVWGANVNPNHYARALFPITTTNLDNIRVRFKMRMLAGSATNTQNFFRVTVNGVQASPTLQASVGQQGFIQYDYDLSSFYTAGDGVVIGLESKMQHPFTTAIASNGIVIDSLEIYNEVQLSAGAIDLTSNPPLLIPGTPVNFSGVIVNSGVTPLNSVVATLRINNAVHQTINVPVNNIPRTDTVGVFFSTPFNPIPGINEVCLVTSAPNGGLDDFSFDDTLCYEFTAFRIIDTYPFCDDFDSNNPTWVTLNPYNYRFSGNSFEVGTPNKAFLDSARSGVNAWVTGGLDSLYESMDSSALFTPVLPVIVDNCYEFEFYHKYSTEQYSDGGTVELSMNSGSSWSQFGFPFEYNWFEQIAVQSLSNFSITPGIQGAGWDGNSGNWKLAKRNFKAPATGNAIFRFRFGSDFSIRDEGWAIDDFCFSALPQTPTCGILSTEDIDMNNFYVMQNFPNPADNSTEIRYYLPNPGTVSLTLTDMLGKVILTKQLGTQVLGLQQESVDVGSLRAGVYFYTVTYNGEAITKKMIVQ